MNVTIGWTPEAEELVIREWREGRSFREIVRSLKDTLHTIKSRNAVIGKVQRLHLPAERSRPSATAKARLAKPAPRPSAVKLARVKSTIPAPTAKLTLELAAGDCKFPVGEATGVDQLHCGARAQTGDSYCARHRQIAGGQRLPLSNSAIKLPRWARS